MFYQLEDRLHQEEQLKVKEPVTESAVSVDEEFLRGMLAEALSVEQYFQEMDRKKSAIMDRLSEWYYYPSYWLLVILNTWKHQIKRLTALLSFTLCMNFTSKHEFSLLMESKDSIVLVRFNFWVVKRKKRC